MKKVLVMMTAALLLTAVLWGCGRSGMGPSSAVEPTDAAPTAATEPAAPETQSPSQETEEEVVYEMEATTYYMEYVYPQQIRRYYTAVSEEWNEGAYFDQEMSALASYYYVGTALDNVGFAFMDLDGDGIWELVIGATQEPLVFEIWALKNDVPVMLAQSGSRNRYYLQYDGEADRWYVSNEGENGAANHAVYQLQLVDGEFKVVQGVVFDAIANEEAPWFLTYDLDWDVSNDVPIDQDTADEILDAGRRIYAVQEYFPYSLYR